LEKPFVCPYLFELDPADLKGPLVQFNAAKATREDTLKLIHTVNDAQEAPLLKAVLEESYEVWWPKLEERLSSLPRPQLEVEHSRPEREILEELLDLAREQAKMNTSRVDSLELFNSVENAEGATWIPNVEFIPGAYVQHPKYGRGLIIRREGKGVTTILTVSFPGFGQKKLAEKYAHLTSA
jgi:hypothetical protein